MQKFFMLAVALFIGTATFAQDEDISSLAEKSDVATNKDGLIVTPEAGDIAIGFDAIPVLNAAGRLVKINTGAADTTNSLTSFQFDQTIYGRYFLDANTAVRASVSVISNSTKSITVTPDAGNDTSSFRSGNTAVVLGGGLEKRRGYGRLQGFYGGQASILVGGSKTVDKFKDPISTDDPSRSNTTTKGGTVFGLGLGGFVGVEYFFARKMSVGAEYTLGLNYQRTGKGKTEVEAVNVVDNVVETTETFTDKSSSFGFNPGVGEVFVSFVF